MSMPGSEQVPTELRARYEEIVERTDAFAAEYLNSDYAELCRRMAAVLAREAPSMLARGEARTWAAGIVYAVGWVNFLSDPSQDPHVSTVELAERMDVGQSTVAYKFRQIRDVIDLTPMDPEWSLPSRLLDHPFVWLVLVDGVPIDIRDAPRELQEEAFHQGAIPFVPADGADRPPRSGPAERAQPSHIERETITMGREPDAPAERVYQLKITLADIEPPIWRRVLVPEDSTLTGLHRVIQAAMGWANYHLWRFQIGGMEYGENLEGGWGEPVRSPQNARLSAVAGAGDVLLYEYDFGDSWEHRVQVERVLPAEPDQAYPVCTAAERACPPEDCGGVPGYEHLLEVLAGPSDPEHDDLLDWLGGPFDPEAVSLDEINQRLARTEPRAASAASDADGAARPHNPAEAAMRAVRAEAEAMLQQALAENPEATLEELNAALQGSLGGYNVRPQPELGGLAPAQMHRLLNADWTEPGSAVRLNESLSLEQLEASRMLYNARLFLIRLGEEGEVRATPKGNLPRAFVAAMRQAMRWPADAEDWLADRKVINEEDAFSLHLLRVLLDLAGLIKRRKGQFSLTRAGERILDDAHAGELFALLFRTHFRTLNLAYLGGLYDWPALQHTIGFSLYQFGRTATDWRLPTDLAWDLVLPPVRDELPQREQVDLPGILLERRLLQPLEGFGLAEVRRLPRAPGEWQERSEYRKPPLFGRFLSFDLEGG